MGTRDRQAGVKVVDVIAIIPSWTPEDRARLRHALEYFDRGHGQTLDPEVRFWSALVSVAEERGIALPPFIRMAKSREFSRFKKDADQVRAFIGKWIRPKTKTEVVHSFRLCARGLLSYMKDMDIPWSVTAIARNTQNVPDAMDRSWPRYAVNGLLLDVVRGEIRKLSKTQ